MPKISIVVATYNRKELLRRCLESILNQTFVDFEVVVVDDGSTDDTAGLFAGQLRDGRLRYFRLPVNQGATTARNRGLDESRGEWSLVWDSDDILYPNALEVLVQAIADNPTAVTVSAPAKIWRDDQVVRFQRLPSGFLSYEQVLCAKMPKFKLIRLVNMKLAGHVRYQAQNIDFVFNTKLVSVGPWYHLDVFLGDHFLLSDANSLTLKRRVRTKNLSIARAPYLRDYLNEFGGDLQRLCPELFAAHCYGAGVGSFLDGQSSVARSLFWLAIKSRPRSGRYWVWWVASWVPGIRLVIERFFS